MMQFESYQKGQLAILAETPFACSNYKTVLIVSYAIAALLEAAMVVCSWCSVIALSPSQNLHLIYDVVFVIGFSLVWIFFTVIPLIRLSCNIPSSGDLRRALGPMVSVSGIMFVISIMSILGFFIWNLSNPARIIVLMMSLAWFVLGPFIGYTCWQAIKTLSGGEMPEKTLQIVTIPTLTFP